MKLWKRYHKNGIPEYLARHYWWAYLWRPGIWFFDHQFIINIILFGQYRKLMRETLWRTNRLRANRTLQLSSAYGLLIPKLAQQIQKGELHLIDVVTEQLMLVRRKLSVHKSTNRNASLLAQMNAEQLAYADNSFDVILIFLLLAEVSADARQNILSEATRILRPTGHLLIVDYAPLTKSHILHRFPPFRFLLTSLEHSLSSFYNEDLTENLEMCASSSGKRITKAFEKLVFRGFYRIAEYQLSR